MISTSEQHAKHPLVGGNTQYLAYLDEFSIWASPLLDVVRRCGCKHVQLGVKDNGPHRLLVVRQSTH